MNRTNYSTLLAATFLFHQCVDAKELWFPPELISADSDISDLSRFARGEQLPGIYKVSVFINQEPQGIRNLNFIVADTNEKRAGITDNTGLMAALTRNDLLEMGVRDEAFRDIPLDGKNSDAGKFISPGSVISHATTNFNFQLMRLDINIPQKWIKKRPRNWIPPERWDDGITAGLLNYAFSGTNSQGRYRNSQSYYLRLNSGINVGPWRLRDEHMMNDYHYGTSRHREWYHVRTWLERGISAWRSSLVVGDTTTDGRLFESFGIRGLSLKTDDGMYPEVERGYAPVVRGTAMSNARISIRQNGYVIYETNVAPGEFVIDDIDPMYSSGDLNVTVTEADGAVRIFTVPYSTLPMLLREGSVHYTLNAGRLNENRGSDGQQPTLVQGTLSWGLPHGITTYGGIQYTRKYRSVALGAGINMGSWGALSADVTHADSQIADGSRHNGQSVRFLYSRDFETTGTTFQLAGYRYSTSGFFTLEENNRLHMSGWHNEQQYDASGRLIPRKATDWYDMKDNRRERIDVNISQRLGNDSSLYLIGSRQSYWRTSRASSSLQGGFSSTLGAINYSLSYSENYNPSPHHHHTEREISLSLSIPMESLFSGAGKSMYASVSAARNNNGEMSQQMSLSGSALEQNNLNWNLSQGYSRQGGSTGNGSLAYRGAYGDISAGYSQGRDYRQLSYNLEGGIVLHRGGLTLGQPLGTTSILVALPGSSGVPLEHSNGVKTDWNGYALQPWATEYQENRVALDVTRLDPRTEVEKPVIHVVPSKGAIVRAEFSAKTGLRVLMTLMKDGKPLPFGTIVTSENSSGIVGDNGLVYLTGLNNTGTLTAKWGNGAARSCKTTWNFIDSGSTTSPLRVTAVCQ
ncbi:fimbria/pilus outer membrane usher protein [Escherichia coli]|uniref:fimbria/pilus outer membrane usher protein n=1 Tax=Escherichia coli TaxID=562 RepID=UPI0038B5683A